MLTDVGKPEPIRPPRSTAVLGSTSMSTRRAQPALVARLRSVPLFAALSEEALERVVAVATEVEVPQRTVLIERAHPGSGVFVILDGTVSVELPGEVVELGPSELVGEVSILAGDERRTARVRAATPVRCLALSRADFTDLLAAEPGFAVAVASILARRLRDTSSAARKSSSE